jgi:pyruvyl transferase EpsO
MRVVSVTKSSISPLPANRQQAVSQFAAQLTSRIQIAIRRFVPDAAGQAVLLDLPAYTNVGDTAIWFGARRLIGDLGIDLTAEFSIWRYRAHAVRRHRPGAIFLQGGGNFGDLWPHHHDLRLRVVRDFPDLPIVQLPQSIYFRDRSLERETARILTAHPRFYLLVRDEESFALAESLVPPERLALAPDCAFAVGSLNAPVPPSSEAFLLLRGDQERDRNGQTRLRAWAASRFGPYTPEGDWVQPKGLNALVERAADRTSCFLERLADNQPSRQGHLAAASIRLRRGLRLLARGEQTGSDRLHALILALLLGKEVHFADTRQGKVSAFYRTWIADSLPWIQPVP